MRVSVSLVLQERNFTVCNLPLVFFDDMLNPEVFVHSNLSLTVQTHSPGFLEALNEPEYYGTYHNLASNTHLLLPT